MNIKHNLSIISRLATGRAWRGDVQRAILAVIAVEIGKITDELIQIAKVKSILFGDTIDETVKLKDELYTLGSTFAMIGEQTSITGKLVIWEFIFDLLPAGTIDNRIDAIISAIINAGSISLLKLQQSLQDSGFNVYVHRNAGSSTAGNVSYGSATYNGFVGSAGLEVRYTASDEIVDPSAITADICVNYIDEAEDNARHGGKFTTDSRRWSYTFFIGGQNKLTRANVDASRKGAFRELILKSKPAGMWALLLIDYI